MKTKIQRHSRSVISVILAISMLISCMMVGLIATDAAKVTDNSEAVGAKVEEDSKVGWSADHDNCIYIKLGSGSFEKKYINSSGYIDFTVDSDTSAEWKFIVEGTWYGNYSGDAKPNFYDKTNYAARDTEWSGSSNFSGTLKAGSYVVYFDSRSDSNHKFWYKFWRKEPRIIGDLATGSWSNTPQYMTKSGDDFYYEIEGNGNPIKFRYWNNGEVYRPWDGSCTNNASNFSGHDIEHKYGATTKSNEGNDNNYFSLDTVSGTKYKIWVNESNTWWSSEIIPTYTIYVKKDVTSWTNVNIYTFTNQTPKQGDWPGHQIITNNAAAAASEGITVTAVEGETNTYKVEGIKEADYVIFNNGDNNGGGNKQTNSKNLEDGKLYTIKETTENGTNNREVVVTDHGTSTSANYYIVGARDDGTSGIFTNSWGKGDDGSDSLSESDRLKGSGNVKTLTIDSPTAGTYYYKAVEKDGDTLTYYPAGSADTTNQTVVIPTGASSVTFTFNSSTHAVSATVTMPADVEEEEEGSTSTWPPADIVTKDGSGTDYAENCYIRYINTTESNSFASNTNISFKRPIYNSVDKYWWFDMYDSTAPTKGFGDLKTMLSGSNNIYYSLSNSNSTSGYWYDGIWHYNQKPTVNVGSTGINSSDNNKDSNKYFVGLYSIPSNATHVGVKITDNGTKFTYTYYITTGSSESATVNTYDIYAKNACVRDGTFNRFTKLANTDIVSVKVPNADGSAYTEYTDPSATKWTDGTWENEKDGYATKYAKLTKVPEGSIITVRTYLSGNSSTDGSFDGKAFADTHYLKAYSINGMTYQLHKASEAKTDSTTNYFSSTANKYYEEEFVVKPVNTENMKNGNTIEITPIYYLQNNANTKTFYVEGFIGDLMVSWGTLLSVYPYYEGKSNKDNAFGGYPGQPMLYYGGKFQMEIPLTVDGTSSGAQVKGLTIHNSYWDLLHRDLDPKCNTAHRQTYDYDDFYKLYKEKSPDTIYFWFKYRNQNDNYTDGYDYTRYDFVDNSGNTQETALGDTTTISAIENRNGAELVTDYYGRQTDLFGTVLPTASQSTYYSTAAHQRKTLKGNELLIVSTGYKDTYVGEYGTIWAVYKQDSGSTGNFTFLGYISSSMLYLNEIGNVKNYTDGTNTANGKMSWKSFTDTYTELKTNYQGVPAIISYDKEIWNDTKDKANRSDGKWYYSFNNERINANIKIQYTNKTALNKPAIGSVTEDAASGWKTDDFSTTVAGVNGENNIGGTTGCSAYFTNTSPLNLYGKTESGLVFVDNEDHFNFQAQSADGYEFAGWVRYNGGEYNEITSQNGLGQSNISANDTYIARFVKSQKGSLVISHNTISNDTYTGTGTKDLTVTINNGTSDIATYTSTDGSDIDVSNWIKSANGSYTIKVDVNTTPSQSTYWVDKRETNTSIDTFALTSGAVAANTDLNQTKAFTVNDVLSNNISALRYTTYLKAPNIGYQYKIKYNYNSRFWGVQSYTQTGTIPKKDTASYFTGTEGTARLLKNFIISKTPYEKNFRQTIKWDYETITDQASTQDATALSGFDSSYTITATVSSSNEADDSVRAEFLLPYKYNATYKSAEPLPVFTNTTDTTENGDEPIYAFDDKSYESFKLTSQVGHLFQYDNTVVDTNTDLPASNYKLVEAAPYVIKNPEFHYIKVSNKRYMTGKSFTVGDITYYLSADDCPNGVADATHVVLTAANTVTFRKPGNTKDTTYHYAVEDESAATRTIYYFSYSVDADDEPLLDGGNYVFNGQYVIYTEKDQIDGIMKARSDSATYDKKYFTCWNIYSKNGTLVAKSYSKKFNYSGYEDYIVIPEYTSSTDTTVSNPGGVYTSVTFMGDGRNQWNEGGLGYYKEGGEYSTKKSDGDVAADKILVDFALAYNYNGTKINPTSGDVKVGMVIERLGVIEDANGADVTGMGQDGAITDLSHYMKKYSTGDYVYSPTTIKNYAIAKANGTTATRPTGCSAAIYCAPTKLDNFNRLQYTYTFTQSSSTITDFSKNQAKYVYRATSFITDGTTTEISATPVYFTLYNIASR